MGLFENLVGAEELKAILQAPKAFALAVFVGCSLGWWAIWRFQKSYYGKQLADKDATIGLLQQRLEYAGEISSKSKDEEKSSTSLASIREGLAAHISVGDILWVEGMRQVTENTLAEWSQRIQGWVGAITDFLRNNLSEAEVALFANATGLTPTIFNDAFSAEHNCQLQILQTFLGNLRQILRDCR